MCLSKFSSPLCCRLHNYWKWSDATQPNSNRQCNQSNLHGGAVNSVDFFTKNLFLLMYICTSSHRCKFSKHLKLVCKSWKNSQRV